MWDKKQSHRSLMPHIEEETREVKEAVLENDQANLKEELGDLLYLILFNCQIARENKHFDITDVLTSIKEKIIRRHPHVFSNVKVNSVEEIKENWKKIKKEEKLSSSDK